MASTNNLTTAYSSLSEDALYCLFTEASWAKMDAGKRLEALQEVECRMARKQGRPICKVISEPMRAGSLGYFSGDAIALNSSLLKSPRSLFGKIRTYGGITALDTVIHEGRHAFQHAAVCGKTTVKVPADVRRSWLVNTIGYMSGNGPAGFAFYAFQPLERDARSFAAQTMSSIYRRVVRATGKSDPLFEQGMTQLRRQKENEYTYARAALSETAIEQQLDAMRLRVALKIGLEVNIPIFGEEVSIQECCDLCGLTTDTINDIIDSQMDDHRAILRGEKGLDEYMDGLMGTAMDSDIDMEKSISPGDKPDSPQPESLDALVARLFSASAGNSFSDSSKVRPDGGTHRF